MRVSALALASLLALPAAAQEWPHTGGTARRDGRTSAVGPIAPTLAWSNTDDFSVIAWSVFVSDGRVFTVRESGFPQDGGAANDAVVAYDLATGAELWRTTLPFGGDTATEWIAWIAAVRDGVLYASRASHLKPGPIEAYDATTGAFQWESAWSGHAFAYDGVVLTDDGDLVVGDYVEIARIDGATGATEWSAARSCPVSGNCGVALHGGGVYFDQPAPGGNSVGKLDLATGALLYESPVMAGFTDQNTPFVAPDGTVYFARTQNDAAVDFLYAFDDDGSSLTERWSVPVRWTTSHEHGVADDGGVYTFNPSEELVRLDPATGAEVANAGTLAPLGSPNLSPQTVVDGAGTVYVSNGWASTPATNGRVWAFDADLATHHFALTLDRPNRGGPALGGDGLLVVADRAGVHAYRAPGLGAAYCSPAVANSTGAPATILARGSSLVPANDVTLDARGLPADTFGYFLSSRTQGHVPNAGGSTGTLCLGGSVGRHDRDVRSSGDVGAIALRLDLAAMPQPGGAVAVVAGETWNFQAWFRDSTGGGGATSNFSDAVAVTFP